MGKGEEEEEEEIEEEEEKKKEEGSSLKLQENVHNAKESRVAKY